MPESSPDNFSLDDVVIRLACEQDHDPVRDLFRSGLLEGQVPGNDTGADIENLQAGYFTEGSSSGFWVADCRGYIVGMIGVQQTSDDTAEIRRLRVRDNFRRRGVGTRLMEEAIAFCRRCGFLKVSLDVRLEREPAISLFQKFGFVPGRVRELDERKTIDFYLDLYRERPDGGT